MKYGLDDPLVRPGRILQFVMASDIHLGDRSARDDVTPALRDRLRKEAEVLSNLAFDHGARVVLVGDVIDGWRYDQTLCVRESMAELEVLARMSPEESRTVWIVGNHDERIEQAGLPEGMFDLASRVILHRTRIEHGHLTDPIPGLWRRIGISTCRALAFLGRNVGARFEDRMDRWLSRMEARIGARGRHADPRRCMVEAFRRIGHGPAEARRIVFGHTHRHGVFKMGDLLHVNTGLWARDGWTLLWDDDLVQVAKWDGANLDVSPVLSIDCDTWAG